MTTTQNQLTDTAIFMLRVALGLMFIAHSLLLKMVIFTLPGTAQFFLSIGLPGWFAYVVFAGEAVGRNHARARCPGALGRPHAGANSRRCDLVALGEWLDVRLRKWRLGIPDVPYVTRHRAVFTRRRRLCA